MNVDPKDAERGVYRKFTVYRNDGGSAFGAKHHGCEYFVLDVSHDPFAQWALRAYADRCAEQNPKLAADLREMARRNMVNTISEIGEPWSPDVEGQR